MKATTETPASRAGNRQRRAYRIIGLISPIFFAGLLVSGFTFYSGKRFDWTAAVISDLQSPEENPRGYVASAVATAVTGGLFLRQAKMPASRPN